MLIMKTKDSESLESNYVTMVPIEEYKSLEVLAEYTAKLLFDEDVCHESNEPRLKFELSVE